MKARGLPFFLSLSPKAHRHGPQRGRVCGRNCFSSEAGTAPSPFKWLGCVAVKGRGNGGWVVHDILGGSCHVRGGLSLAVLHRARICMGARSSVCPSLCAGRRNKAKGKRQRAYVEPGTWSAQSPPWFEVSESQSRAKTTNKGPRSRRAPWEIRERARIQARALRFLFRTSTRSV